MRVTVVGLGKIGVPLAVQFASKGATVCGYDISPQRAAEVGAGRNPFPSEPGLTEAMPDLVAQGLLRATTDAADAMRGTDVVVLIVPVDIDDAHAVEFSALDAAVAAIAPHLPVGALIVVETTVPVGTTRRRVGAMIAEATGLAPGRGFALAFSPERVSSGRVLRDLATYPKIVGGVDATSTAAAVAFYRAMLDADVRTVRDAETAEFSKLVETTYRDVNIALANEFARMAPALAADAREAIAAANTQPYSHVHDPGVGVGGHCIPVYPWFLPQAEGNLIATARAVNDGMAAYAVSLLRDALGELRGATVVVLGLAYRPGVKESRHSSAFGLTRALEAAGAQVFVHDPLYDDAELRAQGLEPPPAFPLPCDAFIVQAWHEAYATLDLSRFEGLRAVLDGRAALDRARIPAAVQYLRIG